MTKANLIHLKKNRLTQFDEKLKQATNFQLKNKEYYNFENSEELVDDFLKNIRSKFNP